ncbi:MAG TPA: flagellar basal-body rod protein FlgG [Candidatus Polarisedimenticolia bacterium]|nr:flagellar basal-body rod protein FlgG [Candidatus Polarisedimenticolia bacterium]
MQRALWSAASGMQAQQLQIDTIANNLANVNTNGFKRSRAEFQDLLYQTITAPGAPSSATTRNPAGLQLGLGVKPGSVKKIFGQGDFKKTDNPLDVVIQGQGFFKVLLPDGTLSYTRDGAFTTNRDGQLVNAQGYTLDPPVTLPPDTLSVTVGADGTVSVTQPGQAAATQVGQIELGNFVNPTGLLSLGGNLFQPTGASGDAVDGTPGLDGLGTIGQGFLEVSNVSIVSELVDMIAAQRAYELNSRAIRASDEMMQQLNSLVR